MSGSRAIWVRAGLTATLALISLVMLVGCTGRAGSAPGDAGETPAPSRVQSESPATRPSEPALPTGIAFQRDSDVFVISTGRGTETPVFQTPETEAEFVWSPNGERALFASNRDSLTETDLYVLDGTVVRRLTDGPGDALGGSWAPDGLSIVYGVAAGDAYSIRIIGADGTDDRELFHDPASWVGNPDWSPDGETIIFGIDRGGGGQIDIYSAGIDGSGLTQLTDAPGDDSGARWSPDGSTIAFWSDRDGGGIYLMDRGGENERRIHADELHLDTAALAWSPDGAQLAWTGKYEGGGGTPVFVMDVDGANLRQITDRLPFRSSIDWHPGSE